MLKWSPFPVVRVVLAFITGILLALNFGDNFHLPGWVYIAAIVIFISAWFIARKRRSITFYSLAGTCGFLCFILAGYRLTQLRPEKNDPYHFSNQQGEVSHYVGFIDDFLVEKQAFYQAVLRLQKIKQNGKWKKATGLIQLTIRKLPGIERPEYGQVLLVKGNPQEVAPPLNPGQFDFKKYQAARNIYQQHFLNGNQYRILGENPASLAMALSIKARDRMEQIFRELVPSQREFGIASALVLGVKDELDNDIKATYSNTGTMHVLAVSGLHVGLVFGLLNLGLKRLRNTKINRLLAAIILLSIIWAFAFITALSASVLRAAVMFTFVVGAQLLQKRSDIYNTLAASALALLFINPYYLLDVGFQLSFVAVLAIVYLQPKIYRLFAVENYWLDKVWALIAVSLAAQVGTMALSLFYFHQFPVYFLLTNLVAVPLSTGILYVGLAVLAFSWVPFLNVALGKLMEWSLWLMNESMMLFEKLPGALVNRIPFSGSQAILIYVFLLLVFIFLANRKLKVLGIATLVLGLVTGIHFQKAFAVSNKKQLIIFAVPKQSVLGIFENGTSTIIADPTFNKNKAAINFNLEPTFLQNQIQKQQFIDWNKPNKYLHKKGERSVFLWHGISIVTLAEPMKKDLARPVEVNYLVLQKNVWIDPEKLKHNFKFKQIIFDPTCAVWYRKWLTPKLVEAGYNVYDVNTEGAFVLEK